MPEKNQLVAPRTYIYTYVESKLVEMNDRVLSVCIEDNLKKVDVVRIELDNHDLAVFDDDRWATGSHIYVSYGRHGRMAVPIHLRIKKVTGGRNLSVEAVNAAAFGLDLKKKSKTWTSKKFSDVVKEVAADNGLLDPKVQETDEVHETITQASVSDGVFLRQLADRQGFDFRVVGSSILWGERDLSPAPVKEYSYYSTPKLNANIIDFGVENDITRKPGRVKSGKRDPINRETIEETADNQTDKDRDTLSGFYLTAGDEDGRWTLNKEPEENEPSTGTIVVPGSKKSAKGAFRAASRSHVKMWISVEGDSDVHAGDIIVVSGMGKRISGKYVVKSVKHDLKAKSPYTMTMHLTTDGVNKGKKKGGSITELIQRLQSCWRNFMSRNRGVVQDYLNKFKPLIRQLDAEISGLSVSSYTVAVGAGIADRLGVLADYLIRFSASAEESSFLEEAVKEVATIAQECYAVATELKAAVISAGLEPQAGKANDKEVTADRPSAITFDDESGLATVGEDPLVTAEKDIRAGEIQVVDGKVNGKPMSQAMIDEFFQ